MNFPVIECACGPPGSVLNTRARSEQLHQPLNARHACICLDPSNPKHLLPTTHTVSPKHHHHQLTTPTHPYPPRPEPPIPTHPHPTGPTSQVPIKPAHLRCTKSVSLSAAPCLANIISAEHSRVETFRSRTLPQRAFCQQQSRCLHIVRYFVRRDLLRREMRAYERWMIV